MPSRSPRPASIRSQLSDLYSRTITAGIFEGLLTFDYLARPFQMKPLTAQEMPEISSDFTPLHLPHPARHPVRRRPGLRRQAARADRARLCLFVQAPLRPEVEEPEPVPARERQAARPERAAQGGARQQEAVPLRHAGRRRQGARPLHAAVQPGRAVAALPPAAADRQLGVRRGGARGGRALWRQDHGAPGRHRPVPACRVAAQLAHRARAQPRLPRGALRRARRRPTMRARRRLPRAWPGGACRCSTGSRSRSSRRRSRAG